MNIDFNEFEKTVYEKFKSTLKPPDKSDQGLAEVIGLFAARVSTIAIKEYHDRINKDQDSRADA